MEKLQSDSKMISSRLRSDLTAIAEVLWGFLSGCKAIAEVLQAVAKRLLSDCEETAMHNRKSFHTNCRAITMELQSNYNGIAKRSRSEYNAQSRYIIHINDREKVRARADSFVGD
jgi:hypothetical protein